MSDVRCQGCGEDRPGMVEVVRKTASGTMLITCATCSKDSVIFPENKNRCVNCGGVGVHEPGCKQEALWAV